MSDNKGPRVLTAAWAADHPDEMAAGDWIVDSWTMVYKIVADEHGQRDLLVIGLVDELRLVLPQLEGLEGNCA